MLGYEKAYKILDENPRASQRIIQSFKDNDDYDGAVNWVEHKTQCNRNDAEYIVNELFGIMTKNVSQSSIEDNVIRCPKCNSTQIQMVQRKWSPLTGFFTNKVDRVCVNCKYKF